MGLEKILELDEQRVQELLGRNWGRWSQLVPALTSVPDGEQLAEWRRTAAPKDVNRVLRGLAELAAADGIDDVDAALVLAWLMLPAAKSLTGSIRGRDVEAHVAARLWIEVRTNPWTASGPVAANIAMAVRSGVLLDLDSAGQLENHDKTLARTVPASEYVETVGSRLTPRLGEPMDDVLAVLDWGCANHVITGADRALLLDVLSAAAEEQGSPSRCQPLLGEKVSNRVGARRGLSGRQVRRRAQRSISLLAESLDDRRRAAVAGLVA
jgi:hypothetical protein